MTHKKHYNMNLPAGRQGLGEANAHRFAELALPNLLMRRSAHVERGALAYRGSQRWRIMARRLHEIESQLSAWEAANPEQYRQLPWYEAREEFKRVGGQTPTWWELAGAADQCNRLMQKGLRGRH